SEPAKHRRPGSRDWECPGTQCRRETQTNSLLSESRRRKVAGLGSRRACGTGDCRRGDASCDGPRVTASDRGADAPPLDRVALYYVRRSPCLPNPATIGKIVVIPQLPEMRAMSAPFDLDAYFQRIGYHGRGAPTLETLREIQARHVQAIPFE